MRTLENQGLHATFFLEVPSSRVVNRQQLADAYGSIVTHGHDVQLHLHPVYYFCDLVRQNQIRHDELPAHPDLIGRLPDSVQLELLCERANLFRAFTGRSPVAFRAGSFGAGQTTDLQGFCIGDHALRLR
jgi:hypothetical protein